MRPYAYCCALKSLRKVGRTATKTRRAANATKPSRLIGGFPAYEPVVEGCGEPGGSPRSREEGGCAGETWFPPRTRAEGERCVSNAFHLRVPEEPGRLHEEDDEDDRERERRSEARRVGKEGEDGR